MPAAAMPGGANTFVPSLLGDKKKKHNFDEAEFERIENVPIFDSHDGQDEQLDLDFTPEVLQQIIDRCNQRIDNTSDYPVVTDGHTEDGQPDPPVLGFAANFRMGELGKEAKKCIYCDLHIRKDKFERAKELPRRSIELWVDDLAADNVVLEPKRSPIDSVALLGATRPARDLGVLFQKKSQGRTTYELREPIRSNMLDPNDLQQILRAVCELPAMKYVAEVMNKAQPEGQPAAEPAKQNYEEDEAKKPDEPQVEDKPKDEEDDSELGKEKLRMQRDQAKRNYAKLESDYKALFAKVESLERKERRADRKAQLMQLEAEGWVFDLADELETVQDYEPARFSKHLAIIAKNYKKSPVGLQLSPAPIPEEGRTHAAAQKTPREAMLEGIKRAEERNAKRSN